MTLPATATVEPKVIMQSDLLGELSVAPTSVFTFREGLFGFPECRRFALLAAAREGMYWLQSAEYAALAFLLVDPFLFYPAYTVDLGAADLEELRVAKPADVLILAIVTLPGTRSGTCTANLQGPLAFGLEAQVAKQVAIAGAEYGVQCPIDLSGTATR